MKPYFESNARKATLRQTAQEWLGTPFVPHSCLKGETGGVDCVQLAAGLYRECGMRFDFTPGQYSMSSSAHNVASQVIDWLEASGHFIRGVYPPLVGDLLCFRIGQCVHHVGIVLTDKTFVHVMRGYGVKASRIDDTTWIKRLAAVYRPIEVTT